MQYQKTPSSYKKKFRTPFFSFLQALAPIYYTTHPENGSGVLNSYKQTGNCFISAAFVCRGLPLQDGGRGAAAILKKGRRPS